MDPDETENTGEHEPEQLEFDFDALLAEAEAEVSAAQEGGEPVEEEEETAETEEDGPDTGELPTEEPQEEEAEGDQDEPEAEGPNPVLTELEALKAELAELKRAAVQPQPKAQPPAPKKTAEREQFEKAVRMALFGTPDQIQTEFKNFPASIQAEASEFARLYAQREVEYALNPAQRFQDQFMPLVQELVHQAIAPIVQERQDRQVREVLAPYMEKLPTKKEREEFARVFSEIPGADSTDPKVVGKVLALAYEKLQWSKKAAELAAREQKAGAVERQQKAIKKARKRTAQAGGGKPAARKRAPDLRPGQDLFEFASKLASGDYELEV